MFATSRRIRRVYPDLAFRAPTVRSVRLRPPLCSPCVSNALARQVSMRVRFRFRSAAPSVTKANPEHITTAAWLDGYWGDAPAKSSRVRPLARCSANSCMHRRAAVRVCASVTHIRSSWPGALAVSSQHAGCSRSNRGSFDFGDHPPRTVGLAGRCPEKRDGTLAIRRERRHLFPAESTTSHHDDRSTLAR
jgi:hypothetical protein